MPDRKASAADYSHSPPSLSSYPPQRPSLQHHPEHPKAQGPPPPPPPPHPSHHQPPYPKHSASSPHEGSPTAYHQARPPPYAAPHPPPGPGGPRSWLPEDSNHHHPHYAQSPSSTAPGSVPPSRRPSQQPPPGVQSTYPGPSPPHQGVTVHDSRPPPPPSPHQPPPHPPMSATHEYYGSPHEPPGHHLGGPHPYPPPHHPHMDYSQHPPQHPIQYDSYPYAGPGHDPRNVSRRQVRATQACEECRKKKSKCDETRPQCQTCQSAGIECHYREVQPPKQERSIIQVLQAIDEVKQQLSQQSADTSGRFTELMAVFRDNAPPGSVQPLLNGSTSTPVHAFGQFAHYGQGSDNGQNNTPSTTHEDVKPPMNGTGSHAHSTEAPEYDILNGEQSMPKSHFTAAHKLVQYPFIKSFFNGVDPDYIKLDAYRGTINLYDRASTFRRDVDFARHVASSPGAASAMSTSSDSAMGKPTYGREPPSSMYSLKPGQIVPIDMARGRYLVGVYMSAMHIMQPFVDVDMVRDTMDNNFFTNSEAMPGSSTSRSGSPPSASPYDNPPPSKKRKGSDGNIHTSHQQKVRELRYPDRSIETAVMLLVFALGEICDHKDNLVAPLEHIDEWRLVQRALAESESTTVAQFIGPYGPGRASSAPNFDHRKLTSHALLRTSSADGPSTPPSTQAPLDPSSRNIDFVPGLSFYAYAVGILGEQLGGETLLHVQAALLAGLYMGQLARVHESYSWIHRAGTAMQGLLKRSKDVYDKANPKGGHTTTAQKTNEYTLRSYWACHQLESDILAELDNPASGITSEEDKISIMFSPRDKGEEEVLQHYNSMIQIRKILNRTHSSLYVESQNVKLSKSGWTNLKAEDLNRQLEQWRAALPSHLQWSDEDSKHTRSVNDARLRGKYYGCKYIINRPYLLHQLSGGEAVNSDKQHTMSHLQDIAAVKSGAQTCIEAAQASTIAFDGIHGKDQRLILTNVFGTVHAQFGNMLVLAAVMMDKEQSKYIRVDEWHRLIDRTVKLFQRLSPLSPALSGDYLILQDLQKKVTNYLGQQNTPIKAPPSANSSFSEHHTMSNSIPTSAY